MAFRNSLNVLRKFSTTATNGKSSSNLILGATAAAIGVGAGYYYLQGKKPAIPDPAPVALVPDTFVDFKLSKVEQVSHDTKKFTFELPGNHELGLPVAGMVMAKLGKIVRPYTPISPKHANGYFDLLIKIYPTGKFTQEVNKMKPGDVLQVKGPIVKWNYKPNEFQTIGMVAGGTGITPMLQVIREVLNNPQDQTKLKLIFGNVSPKDILLKDELDKLAQDPRLEIQYIVDKGDKSWTGKTGYVTEQLIKDFLPAPNTNSRILTCGPPPMVNALTGPKNPDFSQGELTGLFKKLGYSKEEVFKY